MTFYQNRVHITLPNGRTADVPTDGQTPVYNKYTGAQEACYPAHDDFTLISPKPTQRRSNGKKASPKEKLARRNSVKLWPMSRKGRGKRNSTSGGDAPEQPSTSAAGMEEGSSEQESSTADQTTWG